MNSTSVALLIDADNLSGDVIEQAVEHLLQVYGAIRYRRAYASPQKVVEHLELFRRLAIRPMVNVPTGKNSTDIALAVDAIDLAICEQPDVVVIGSSDSDYAPLAQRLREKGCRVLGIGQAGKTGHESPLAYDEFIDLAHRRGRDAVPVARPARARAPART
ncbi:MAG: NYN domain-containing protein, partial [Pseudomonadota bacterium]|nr:NYN domain-containing protein [Pseudomonadota bacterium]